MEEHKTLTIGDAVLYLGDSYEIAPSLGSVDCMVTDPAYKFNASGGGMFRRQRKCMDDIQASGLDKGFDKIILRSDLYNSVILFCHNDQLHDVLPYLAQEYDRHVVCFWEKTNPMPVANRHYQPNLEPYVHAWKKGFYPTGELSDKKRSIKTNNGKSEYDHPTVKPAEVMDKIMMNANGETIIDPFAGTGSTGIAALKAGKKFIGIEQNEKYFSIMCSRIMEYYATKDF